MFKWNPSENSADENSRYVHLRAIEWASWPAFISQPIAPIALLVFPWRTVVLFTVLAGVLWTFLIRDFFIIPVLADAGPLIVRLKWLACPITAGVLALRGSWGIAALALLWPLVAAFMPGVTFFLKPPFLGDIEMRFARSLGYEPIKEQQHE
jgi:hypothetical protein